MAACYTLYMYSLRNTIRNAVVILNRINMMCENILLQQMKVINDQLAVIICLSWSKTVIINNKIIHAEIQALANKLSVLHH